MAELKLAQYYHSTKNSTKGVEILKDVGINYSIPDTHVSHQRTRNHWQGYTSLHFLAQKLDLDLIKQLLEKGANLDKQDTTTNKCTPLHIANNQIFRKKSYYFDKSDGEDNSYRNEISQGCNVIHTLLSKQIKDNNTVNPKDRHGVSHLHIACIANHVEAIEFFARAREPIDQSIKYNLKNDTDTNIHLHDELQIMISKLDGYTPLHCAVQYSSFEAVSILLRYGADVNLKNARGMSCVHLLIERIIDLTDFITMGKRMLCMPILQEIERIEFILKLMLEESAKNNLFIDDTGLSLLHVACTLRDKWIVTKFLKQGVDMNMPLKCESKFWPGWTPLHFAACSNIETMILLIESGADFTIKNSKGETPLDLCAKRYASVDVQLILSMKREFKDIILSDDCTKLSDLLIAMNDLSKFSSFLQEIKDVNLTIPYNSLIWAEYTLLHLAISLNEKTQTWEDFEKEYYLPDSTINLLERYNCTEEQENLYWKRIEVCLNFGCSLKVKNANGQTPIHLAFNMLRGSTVEKLLDHCEDNIFDENGFSHLHIACVIGHLDAVKKFLSSGADVNCRVKKSFDWPVKSDSTTKYHMTNIKVDSTSLHLAVMFDHKNLIQYLIENDADVDAKDSLGLTPIHLLMSLYYADAKKLLKPVKNWQESVNKDGLSHLHVAAYVDDEEAVKQILLKGAQIDRVVDANVKKPPFLARLAGKTPLHVACHKSDKLIEALLKGGANIHAKDLKGISVLQYSIDDLDEAWTEPLIAMLKSGECDVGSSGVTLLHFACGQYDHEWAEKLLKEGADVNAKISEGNENLVGATPLFIFHMSAFIFDIEESVLVNLVKLLLDYGADVTIECCGCTPLYCLFNEIYIYGNYDLYAEDFGLSSSASLYIIADLLLESQKSYTVNPVSSKDGFSHFHIACARNNVNVVMKFLEHGVDINHSVDPFQHDIGGFTPLHFALAHQNKEMAYLLLGRSANPRAEDVHGNTPLHVAIKRKFIDLKLMETIINLGANIHAKNIEGETPLYCLLKCGDLTLERLEFFLHYDCCINISNFTVLTNEFCQGIMGYAMRNTQPSEWQAILERLVNLTEVENAIQNGFNIIQNLVAVEQDGTSLTVDSYLQSIKFLISIGCDLDQQDTKGQTALHKAASFYNLEAVHALLQLGADVNVVDCKNECPLSELVNESVGWIDGDRRRREKVLKVLARYIWKMNLIELHANASTLKSLKKVEEKFHFVDNIFRLSCELEWLKVQITKIGQFVYVKDFLSELGAVADYPTMGIVRRETVDKFFKCTDDLRHEFPEIFGLLTYQYRKVLTRMELLQPAKQAILQICQIELADLCLEAILRYFTNDEMKLVIESVKKLPNHPSN